MNHQKYRVISPLLLQHHISPVEFVNIYQSKEQRYGKSFINEMEIHYILQFLVYLVKHQIINPPSIDNSSKVDEDSMTVAIISPYKAQVRALKERCLQHHLLKPFFPSANDNRNNAVGSLGSSSNSNNNDSNNNIAANGHHQIPIIEINTVDGFQGREKDIVLMSTVRSNTIGGNVSSENGGNGGTGTSGRNMTSAIGRIGFVSDERRLNVSITRARKCLFVFGNVETLIVDKVWKEMIEALQKKERIHTPQQLNYFQ